MDEPRKRPSIEDRLSEFYKEHYFNELRRREELAGRITLPFGVLSILIGGFVAAFREVKKPDSAIEYVIAILLVGASLLAGLVIINLWRSYHNNTYWVIETPAQILRYKEDLASYYEEIGTEKGGDPNKKALWEVLDYIDGEYAKHADYNSRVNDRRSFFLLQANTYLAITLAVAALTLILQLVRLASLPEQPQTVRIVNIREFTMASPTGKPGESTSGSGSASNTAPPRKPAPQKPQPPGGRLIREGTDPGQVRR